MISVHARLDLDRILEGLNPDSVEEKKRIKVQGGNKLARVCRKYEQFYKIDQHFSNIQWQLKKDRFVRNPRYRFHGLRLPEVLSPVEINSFVQSKLDVELDFDTRFKSELFLSKLIQNSYAAGFQDFKLLLDKPNWSFPWYLLGNFSNPLKMAIHGSLSSHGYGVEGVNTTLYGNVFRIENMQSSFLEVYGDVGFESCNNARDSTFIFHGKFIFCRGYSRDLPHSNQSIGSRSGRCLFKTTNRETLEDLSRYVCCGVQERQNGGHKIIFIHPDGHEEVRRNFHYDD